MHANAPACFCVYAYALTVGSPSASDETTLLKHFMHYIMTRKLLLPAIVLMGSLFFLLASCSKDDITLNPGNAQTIRSLFSGLKYSPEVFTVQAGSATTITGSKGTRITFYPGTFRNAAGNTITGGNIRIELIEMYSPGDMIANHVTTTTAAQRLLTSGGCIHISATQDGQEVFADTYGIAFKQPAQSDNPMALFTGYQVSDSTGVNIKWSDDTTSTVLRTLKIDNLEPFYYIFDSCTSFNWINCDYFYNAPAPKTDVRVTLPDNSYDMTNTQVFVIFPAINAVVTTYAFDQATRTFSFGNPSYHLPVGAQVDVLVVGSKNNVYFADLHSNITLTPDFSVSANPTTQSLTAIQSMLAGL